MRHDETVAAHEHATRVRRMFSTIAGRYDLLNHLLSINLDRRWRRLTAAALRDSFGSREIQILDVACGTGDLSLVLFEMVGARVIGADFSRPMLEIAAAKAAHFHEAILFLEADALNLPFPEGSFEVATIGFGLRNLANTRAGLKELWRVLKPGGRVAVLEFSRPVRTAFRPLFQLYFTKLLPLVGGFVSGSREAYSYLPRSVSQFPDQEQLSLLMQSVGFEDIQYRNFTGGVAALHLGKRPG